MIRLWDAACFFVWMRLPRRLAYGRLYMWLLEYAGRHANRP